MKRYFLTSLALCLLAAMSGCAGRGDKEPSEANYEGKLRFVFFETDIVPPKQKIYADLAGLGDMSTCPDFLKLINHPSNNGFRGIETFSASLNAPHWKDEEWIVLYNHTSRLNIPPEIADRFVFPKWQETNYEDFITGRQVHADEGEDEKRIIDALAAHKDELIFKKAILDFNGDGVAEELFYKMWFFDKAYGVERPCCVFLGASSVSEPYKIWAAQGRKDRYKDVFFYDGNLYLLAKSVYDPAYVIELLRMNKEDGKESLDEVCIFSGESREEEIEEDYEEKVIMGWHLEDVFVARKPQEKPSD